MVDMRLVIHVSHLNNTPVYEMQRTSVLDCGLARAIRQAAVPGAVPSWRLDA